MNSIISPWVFYWIETANSLKGMLLIVVIISLIATVLLALITMCDADDYSFQDKKVIRDVKNTVKAAVVSLVLSTLFCLIPDSDTCYKMLAANMFTQDNINSATDYVTDVIDYAVDKVKELNPADSTKE